MIPYVLIVPKDLLQFALDAVDDLRRGRSSGLRSPSRIFGGLWSENATTIGGTAPTDLNILFGEWTRKIRICSKRIKEWYLLKVVIIGELLTNHDSTITSEECHARLTINGPFFNTAIWLA